jgi:hypothetical protein
MGYKKGIASYEKTLKPIDRMELLSVLGKIYAKTAGSPAKISLRKIISQAAPSVKAKLTPLSATLVRTGLLTRTGTQARLYEYYWNWRKFGPPSLPMCDWIIEETRKTSRELSKKMYLSRKARGLYTKND